jgi:uncharacterized membrane protein
MNTPAETKPRIQSIDLLRGLVMVIMALDHCRDFLHFDSVNGSDPLDFKTTTTGLFLTRWITHYCAPIFVFLAGTSIYFVSKRRSLKAVSGFLITRGLWLIVLEVTIIYYGWVGNLNFSFVGLFVIWALGCGMMFMAGLVHLPKNILLVLGILLVFGHNLLDRFDGQVTETAGGFLWSVFHVPQVFPIDSSHNLFIGYPLLPWIGIMILGYLFGQLYNADITYIKRRKTLTQLGLGSIGLFILLRSGNFYGDAHHWQTQSTGIFSLLSFVDTTKYPPSLLYALMTIGPAFLFLAFAEMSTGRITQQPKMKSRDIAYGNALKNRNKITYETWKNKFIDAITVFGRVPFFYYILHIYLIHAVALVVFIVSGYSLSNLDPAAIFGGFPKGFGVPLWAVYLLWAAVVVALYLPCRWYNKYKTSKGHWWLSYV